MTVEDVMKGWLGEFIKVEVQLLVPVGTKLLGPMVGGIVGDALKLPAVQDAMVEAEAKGLAWLFTELGKGWTALEEAVRAHTKGQTQALLGDALAALETLPTKTLDLTADEVALINQAKGKGVWGTLLDTLKAELAKAVTP